MMVTAWAQHRKMNYVVSVTNLQPAGADPNSVMAAFQNTMVYYDPRNDITNDVIYNLNLRTRPWSRTPRPAEAMRPSPLRPGRPPATPRRPTRTDPSSSAMH